ncbi:hypothetical protein JCM1406_09210 [Clostridium novyi]
MKKLIDGVILISITIFSFFIFTYCVLISSDIPVNISRNEFILFVILDGIYLMIYLIYIFKRLNFIKINIALILFQIWFWFIMLISNIRYKYHLYCTLISIIGFSIKIIIFILLIYKLIRLIQNNKNIENTKLG